MNTLGWCTNYENELYDYLQMNNSKAFILLKDGKIVIEKYFGTFTQDSLWYWASAGKSLTSFLVGIAQQEHLLSIEDTSSKYIGTAWTSEPIAKENLIKVKHQLTMTTGLDDGVPDNNCTVDTCLQYLVDAGTRWAYHNAPYTLLDSVISNASGMSMNNFLHQKVSTPTGINGFYYKTGYDNVFFSKARSMARFGLLILNKGKWDQTPVLTDSNYFYNMAHTSQAYNLSYGYLWWLNGKASFMVPQSQLVFPGSLSPHAPQDMIAALGKNGQMLNIVPSQNVVWIRMGDAPDAGLVPFLMNDSIWLRLNKIMCTPSASSSFQQQNAVISTAPNPFHDFLTLHCDYQNFEIRVSNIFGEMIYKDEGIKGNTPLNLSFLPKGIYILHCISSNGNQVIKIEKD
ncbi:MAG: penicillin-binding protein, beta-lactamase class C [Bacteroidetes bacterium OLB11]|nr:MAG: penicillin-binding protein, beta-lactamase class C [Bacteroidetes bacterium OLB11]